VYCSFSVFYLLASLPSPSLPPAISKKSQIKKVFSFWVEVFFSYRVNIENQRDKATEKEDKHKPGKLPLPCLLV